jgi:hypothetical protein
MAEDINDLKKLVFYEMLDLTGRVYIHVAYSQDVVIGDRGFLPEEKEKGIVLVLNNRMNFTWDEGGISVNLVFGSTKQKCYVPADAIISVVSPELKSQFTVSPEEKLEVIDESIPHKKTGQDKGEKVIKVDFKKKR